MGEEQVLNLFDIYWFYHKSSEKSPPPPPPIDPVPVKAETQIEKPPISRLRSLHRRSHSDHLSSNSGPFSPNSVLPEPKLETILSGKEAGEMALQEEVWRPQKKGLSRRKKTFSRSLSELEFQELKGFIDLGFTFPETEMDSRLVSIVPGLQRLGKKPGEEEEPHVVSRPYLSEAWSFVREEGEEGKKEDPLTNWRIPSAENSIDMKDQLRFWAHAVASAVR